MQSDLCKIFHEIGKAVGTDINFALKPDAITTQLKKFSTFIKEINQSVFLVVAACTGIMVAVKFINSRDKKAAVNYAVWWVAGIVFFSSFQAIIESFTPSQDPAYATK